MVRGRDGLRLIPEEFVLFDEVMVRLDLIVAEPDDVMEVTC